MIEARLLSVWDDLVGSAALITIIVLALCVMVDAVKLSDAPRHLGLIVGVVILLIMLPAIIVGLWNTMSFGQHVGIVTACLLFAILLIAVYPGKRGHQGMPRKRG